MAERFFDWERWAGKGGQEKHWKQMKKYHLPLQKLILISYEQSKTEIQNVGRPKQNLLLWTLSDFKELADLKLHQPCFSLRKP